MSIANNYTAGNRGSNFHWQLIMTGAPVKAGAYQSAGSGSSGGGGVVTSQTPFGPITSTGPGTVPANAKSITVYNAGSASGIVNGGSIKSGLSLTFAAQDGSEFPTALTYDATGTTLIITYII